MLERIDSYIYSKVSFSTYYFDDITLNFLKYQLSKLKKRRYIHLISSSLFKSKYNCIDQNNLNYYLYLLKNSLENATLFLNLDKSKLKLLSKYLKKEINYSNSFKVIDLSNEIKMERTTFILNSKDEIKKYAFLINNFENYNFILMDDIMQELTDNTHSQTIFDLLKLKLLKDQDSEVYFIQQGIYSNVLSLYIYELNKVAIIL